MWKKKRCSRTNGWGGGGYTGKYAVSMKTTHEKLPGQKQMGRYLTKSLETELERTKEKGQGKTGKKSPIWDQPTGAA